MDKHVNVSELFDKKFQFKSHCIVPKHAFQATKWSIPILQKKKINLNSIKAQLGKYNLEEWSKHTKRNDLSSFVVRSLRKEIIPELLTQAWCKFYECLSQFDIIPNIDSLEGVKKFMSLHLCEAPGGFISSLNHYIKSNYEYFEWDWFANTLHPDYEGNKLSEMVPDDRLFRMTTEKWFFGVDTTGDITKYHNYVDLVEKVKEKLHLITADGSIDCMFDPGNQENVVSYLHYCETICALTLLHKGGTFVLKIFTTFEDSTVCLLYLLNISFETVNIFKPCTSKAGNSEVYVICTGFKELSIISSIWEDLKTPFQNGQFTENVSMFDLSEIPTTFLKEIEVCADFFMNLQIETISNNIETFRKRDTIRLSLLYHTKVRVANMFLRKFKIKKISTFCKLVPHYDVNIYHKFISLGSTIVKKNSEFLKIGCTDNLFCIKYGKKIEELGFSRYCHVKYYGSLNIFRKIYQDHFSLYNRVFMDINDNYLIINRNDFDCSLYCDFQKQFFDFFLCNDLDKDIIILDIPFLTNFFVGFLFLLCTVYEEISFNLSGSIMLKNLRIEEKLKICNYIKSIENSYNELPGKLPYDLDILGIIPTNFILYNDFHDMIYAYNNVLMNRITW